MCGEGSRRGNMPQRASETQINSYYQEYFPLKEFCSLLSRSWLGESQLHRREIAFELHGNAYVRYQNVSSEDELLRLFRSKRAVDPATFAGRAAEVVGAGVGVLEAGLLRRLLSGRFCVGTHRETGTPDPGCVKVLSLEP